MNHRSKTGVLGEDIASRFLLGKGYDILDRNYRSGYGEIDIIAKDAQSIVFVEVKTVSRGTHHSSVPHETYRPEDNVHEKKLQMVIQTGERYLASQNDDSDWRVDVVAVELEKESLKATIRHLRGVS